MNDKELMNVAEDSMIHVYNRFPVVLDHGEGVYLYDANGKKYLDFYAGIAVSALGYGNEELKNAIKSQVDKIMQTSNLFYNEPAALAAKALKEASGLEKVFFTNSGAEAIETALKIAKRYAYNKKGNGDYEIIAMNHSFHGRTIGAVSVTGNEHYREPFLPLLPGVKFADFNDFDSVLSLVNDNTCAIILEPVQGEGGIIPATKEFMKSVRALCDERDILMICDEIQCGMGRCGEMFAFMNYDIVPDIITTAKALGCGVPVGAAVAGDKCKDSLVPGDHGTTYGGNPLACAAVAKVFELYDKLGIINHVKKVSDYLHYKLEELMAEHDNILEIRGAGLLKGLLLKEPVGEVITKAREMGLIVISASGNVLRLVPPLIVTTKDIDDMCSILDKCL